MNRKLVFLFACFAIATVGKANAEVQSAPCLTVSELIAWREPQLGGDWLDQVRNLSCSFEITEPEYSEGELNLFEDCDKITNCYGWCGDAEPSGAGTKSTLIVNNSVEKTEKVTWTNEIAISGSLQWGNKESATSLIVGAAEATITAGWTGSKASEDEKKVTVGKSWSKDVEPCNALRMQIVSGFVTGKSGKTSAKFFVQWDEHCTIHKQWYNARSAEFSAGNLSLNTDFSTSGSCQLNLASGTCDGFEVTWDEGSRNCLSDSELKAECPELLDSAE